MGLLLKEKFLTEDIDVSSHSGCCAGSHHWLHIKTTKGSVKTTATKTIPGPHCQDSDLIGLRH